MNASAVNNGGDHHFENYNSVGDDDGNCSL